MAQYAYADPATSVATLNKLSIKFQCTTNGSVPPGVYEYNGKKIVLDETQKKNPIIRQWDKENDKLSAQNNDIKFLVGSDENMEWQEQDIKKPLNNRIVRVETNESDFCIYIGRNESGNVGTLTWHEGSNKYALVLNGQFEIVDKPGELTPKPYYVLCRKKA